MNNTVAPVYVVDDDVSVREAVGSLIRSAGLSVETFASAQQFLASPRAKVPSCFVLDVQLPGLSGIDLQQELVKTEVQVPIIFLSGHGDIPTTVRAMKAGALDFLTKPIDDEVLLGAILQAIARHPRARGLQRGAVKQGFEEIVGDSPFSYASDLATGATGIVSSPVLKSKPIEHAIPVPGDTRIRVFCLGGSPMLLEGIGAFLCSQPDMQLVGHAANAQDGIQQFREHRPDVTLMDLQLPDMSGIDAIGAIREKYSEARLIILATHSGDVQALRALKAGARAYLLKDTLHEELLKTIRAVHAGKKTVSAEVSFQLAEHAIDDGLTPAEVRVLRLIADGNANREIAARLLICEETVKGQVKNILSKLGANDRTHAAMIGLKRGIVEF
jgi:DNA-binding NarL/FixJ family response regulator